jgi:hypothetical protein
MKGSKEKTTVITEVKKRIREYCHDRLYITVSYFDRGILTRGGPCVRYGHCLDSSDAIYHGLEVDTPILCGELFDVHNLSEPVDVLKSSLVTGSSFRWSLAD